MKLNKQLTEVQLLNLEQSILYLASKTTKSYLTDIIIDIHALERKNTEYKLDEVMVFICRENGVELGALNDIRIHHYYETFQRYDSLNKLDDYNDMWYTINLKALSEIADKDIFNFWQILEQHPIFTRIDKASDLILEKAKEY